MQHLALSPAARRLGRLAQLAALLALLVAALAAPRGAAAAGCANPSCQLPAGDPAVTFSDDGIIHASRDGFWRTVRGICANPSCQQP
jgi:hypothetical protein